jgi:arylsulfatase A-like enzyme
MRVAARVVSLLITAAAVLWTAACTPSAPEPERPNVIFIVLDNVRSDRLAQCGYERPTSPFLDRLCARNRSQCTCDAQAPSTWTLPTHASYFTGTEVPQHGAGMGGIGGGNVRLFPGTHARPLDDKLPTLAERFAERGYQTVMVSGNPLLSAPSGLTRGFAVVQHAREFGRLYGARLVNLLDETLAQQAAEEPLFLFVNIADAHRPWFEIPDDIGWVPPRPYLSFKQKPGRSNKARREFVTGVMSPERAAELLAHLNDVYDWAVWRADETLGGVLRVLRNGGWMREPKSFRLILTSDHGEHLGDHRLMGHAGPYLYEEMTRVPLVVYSSQPVRELPRQISALVSYDLALGGQPRRRPVRATAFASDTWPGWYGPEIGAAPGAALWQGSLKTVHHDGRVERYDLERDPGEESPIPWTGKSEVEELAALIQALESVVGGEPPSDEMLQLLKDLGYV